MPPSRNAYDKVKQGDEEERLKKVEKSEITVRAAPVPLNIQQADIDSDDYDVVNEGYLTEQAKNWSGGKVQPKRFNDKCFAIIFVLHIICVLCLAVRNAPIVINDAMYSNTSSLDSNNDNRGLHGIRRLLMGRMTLDMPQELIDMSEPTSEEEDPHEVDLSANSINDHFNDVGGFTPKLPTNKHKTSHANKNTNNNNDDNPYANVPLDALLSTLFISFLSACIIPNVALITFMSCKTQSSFKSIIQGCLFFITGFFFVEAIVGMILGNGGISFKGLLFCIIYIMLSKRLWNQIPFAASSLNTAVTAIKATNYMGMFSLAYANVFLTIGWIAWWTIATLSSLYVWMDCHQNGEVGGCDNIDGTQAKQSAFVFVCFLSLFWTRQVIQNTLHVTIAGIIGTWYFTPSEYRLRSSRSRCCSNGSLMASLLSSVTDSFGSICFGSLCVTLIETVKNTLYHSRSNRNSCLNCVLECMLQYMMRCYEYINRWAFIFVGLYGYSFCHAGKNVVQMFKSKKGWMTVVMDVMVNSLNWTVDLTVGIVTGVVSGGVSAVVSGGDIERGFEILFGLGFVLGLLFGMFLSSILMSIISSAVETVFVCYAEAPSELQANHPNLAVDMNTALQQTWPNQFSSSQEEDEVDCGIDLVFA